MCGRWDYLRLWGTRGVCGKWRCVGSPGQRCMCEKWGCLGLDRRIAAQVSSGPPNFDLTASAMSGLPDTPFTSDNSCSGPTKFCLQCCNALQNSPFGGQKAPRGGANWCYMPPPWACICSCCHQMTTQRRPKHAGVARRPPKQSIFHQAHACKQLTSHLQAPWGADQWEYMRRRFPAPLSMSEAMSEAGCCLVTRGGRGRCLGPSADPSTHTHIRNIFLGGEPKLIKGDRNVRPISGTQPVFWPLTHPPNLPPGPRPH